MKRQEKGAYQNLVRELNGDTERFQQYFRLTREQFAQVLFLVGFDSLLLGILKTMFLRGKFCLGKPYICDVILRNPPSEFVYEFAWIAT